MPDVPASGGVHHVFLTVNDLARSRPFYAALMPRLGYPAMWEYEGQSVGWLASGMVCDQLSQMPARRHNGTDHGRTMPSSWQSARTFASAASVCLRWRGLFV